MPFLLFPNLKYKQKTTRARRSITTSGKYSMKFSSGGDEQILDKTVDSGVKERKKKKKKKIKK